MDVPTRLVEFAGLMRATSTKPTKKLAQETRVFRGAEFKSVVRQSALARWLDAPSLTFYLTTAAVAGSVLLGGGTRGGFLSDATLELLSLPLLLYFLWSLSAHPLTHQLRVALAFCVALAALPFLQLIPLPAWLWTTVPTGEVSSVYDITGRAAPWMPISASPLSTWLALLSLIPPLAVFLGVVQLSYRERRWLSVVVIGFGTLSVLLGLVQVAQGPASGLRFFEITNPSEAVGFFANRNHFAALVYCVIVFAVAWTIPTTNDLGTKLSQWQFDAVSILKAIAAFIVLVMLLAGETMARSRAGLALTIVALFGALALGLSYQTTFALGAGNVRERFRMERLFAVSPTKLIAAAIALTVIFSLQYALYRVQERFEADPVDDARLVFLPNTIEAAKAYLPFGSGLGTFPSVYPLFEKAEGTMPNKYANRAHNDAAEVTLEAGVFGLALMGLFVTWLAYRAAAVWSGPLARGASVLDQTLARAATIVIGLLLAHSVVDYPLRTGAMAAVFAIACAFLIPPPVTSESSAERILNEDAHFPPEPAAAKQVAHVRPMHAKTRDVHTTPKPNWGDDINWPKEWITHERLPDKSDGDPQT